MCSRSSPYDAPASRLKDRRRGHRPILMTGEMTDAQMAYVAFTRHRDRVDLFYNRVDFATDAKPMRKLGRERLKDTTLDYQLAAPDPADLPEVPSSVLGPMGGRQRGRAGPPVGGAPVGLNTGA